ncbi:MAG: T9SS type A sorting domain-containing protein, partial [Flavobacteriales bacterium]
NGVVTHTFQDADLDGVCDASDTCPGTASGAGVNASGCSCAQVTVSDGNPCTLDVCTNGNVTHTFQDADGDLVCDANDNCPNTPGQIGSTCNDGDANTTNDMLNASCVCAGTCSGNAVALTLQTDANGSQTTWEIKVLGGAQVCSGSGYTSNSTIVASCCLPTGCYQLLVYDSFGDGMTTGGYVLRTGSNQRIIDNANDGAFTFTSTVAAGFCVPLGTDALQPTSCDLNGIYINSVLYAVPNSGVSGQYGIGNQTDDGYQFWFFDPDGSYGRNIFKSHANPGSPGTPAGPTACASIKLSSMVTSPLPLNKLLNVRIRSRVNGVYSQYGPACRLTVGNPTSSCITQLDPTAGTTFSCGATGKVVGASGNSGKIHASSVSGANKYQFEFVLPGTAYVRTIASATTMLTLNPWATSPLVCGNRTYNVRVRASFDNGTTYCNYGPLCTVGITNSNSGCTPYTPNFSGGGQQSAEQGTTTMDLFPNPVRDGAVTLELSGLSTEVAEVTVDVFDLFGRKVIAQVIATEGAEGISTRFDLPSDMATGIYMVSVVAGDVRYAERLTVE